MRQPKLYMFRGRRATRADVCRITGWSPNAVTLRVNGDIIEDRPRGRGGRKPKLYDFRGERKTVKEIAAATGLSLSGVQHRISGTAFLENDGTTPFYDLPTNSVPVFFQGETMSISAWARKLGMSPATLQFRLSQGWSVKRALTEPVMRKGQRQRYRRNAQIIARMLDAFTTSTSTGGVSVNFPDPNGDRRGEARASFAIRKFDGLSHVDHFC